MIRSFAYDGGDYMFTVAERAERESYTRARIAPSTAIDSPVTKPAAGDTR